MIDRIQQLEAECKALLENIDRWQPGGRGRHHLEVKLRRKLAELHDMKERSQLRLF